MNGEVDMVSRMLRRSGHAVGVMAEFLEWEADWVIQVGVGFHHQEIDVLHEEWPNCKMIGFEANPVVADKIDNYPGELVSMAVGEKKERVELFFNERHKDGGSLHRHNEQANERYGQHKVSMERLDNLGSILDKVGGNVLLWLDCEGSELGVLRGAEEFIQRVGMLNVEVTANPLQSDWCSPVDVFRWLRTREYFLQWIHTQRCSAGQSDHVYVKPDLFRPEYCCCPYAVQDWERFRQGQSPMDVFKG